MEFQQFIRKVQKGVKTFLGEKAVVEIKSVRKNNGVVLEGLCIRRKEETLSPTVYLNSFYGEYEKGKTLGEVVREIIDIYESAKTEETVDISFFEEYEKVGKKIFCKLVNCDKNIEMLKEVPHEKFLDLALVCYYAYTNDAIGNGTITVCLSHLRQWGVDAAQLFALAKDNTRKKLGYEWLDMKGIVKDMLREQIAGRMESPETENETRTPEWTESLLEQMAEEMERAKGSGPMYVLTNRNRFLGAVCMAFEDILKKMGMIIGDDYYILPSSIHELILLPAGMQEGKGKLEQLVGEVNATQVEPEEVLSDSVYFYSRERQEVIRL